MTDVWEERDLVWRYGEKEAAQYGIRAFNTNYPNVIDNMNNKNGYGIWLHATDKPERIRQPYDTKGCIVIQNNDMIDVTPFITLGKTPIIVVNELEYLPERVIEQERSLVEQFIEAWRSSWESREILWYEEFYSRKFKGDDFDYDDWIRYKKLIFSQYSCLDITISELRILKFDEYYLAEFHQNFQSEVYEDAGIKQLYIRHDGDGNQMKIISELWIAQNEIKNDAY